MRTLLLVPALLAVFLLPAPAADATDFCNGVGQVLRVGVAPTFVAYVTLDPWMNYLIPWWVYVESNGQPDLQRGGVSPLGDADVCQDSLTPDLLVF